jgi:hypothetical protein
MDPLSLLGAVAAASQLVAQGIQITFILSDLCLKAKEAPDTIRKQTAQVEQLINLARLIIQTPSLQKDSIASVLGTCLRTAEQCLASLKKEFMTDKDGKLKKAQKLFSALLKEKEIGRVFDDLEKEKTSLILCITAIDS